MKIAYFTDTYYPQVNGVSVAVDKFTRELRERGHTVYLFAPKIKNHQQEDKFLIRLSSFKILSSEPEVRMPVLVDRALFKCFNLDFKLISAHGNGPFSLLGLLIARIRGIPFVLTFHTMHTEYTHYFFNGKLIKPKVVGKLLKLFAGLCDGIVAPSEKMRAELKNYGIKKDIKLIPYFIDYEDFQTKPTKFLHKKLKIAKSSQIILSVGRLGQEKNFSFLIKMFAGVVKSNNNAHLVIVGQGPEKQKLITLASQLKLSSRVHFTGSIPPEQMPSVYADADVFVFSSTTETQGLVVLEAAASGLPIMAIKDQAFERIIYNGENGFLLPAKTSVFAEKILQLLNNNSLRIRLGRRSRQIVKTNFDKQKIVSELLRYYQQIVQNHKTRFFGYSKMRTIKSRMIIPPHIKNPWQQVADINSYPNFIKFMKEARLLGPVKVGTNWYDVTTILGLPIKINHKIIKIVQNKEISYEATLPLGGKMWQKISLIKNGTDEILEAEIKFKFKQILLDYSLGFILEKRLNQMVQETFKNLKNL